MRLRPSLPWTATAAALGFVAASTQWGTALVATMPGRRIAGSRLLWRVPADAAGPRVALTFDDGPDPHTTAAVLDALDGHRATFFVVGEHAAQYPSLVAEAAAAGHTIGLHGHRHIKLTRRTPRAAIDDIRRGHDAVAAAAGTPPRYYRPPHGLFTLAGWSEARRLGMRPTLWDVSAGDWRPGATPSRVIENVTSLARPGSIVLLHDNLSVTVAAIPGLLQTLQERGLEAVSLGQYDQ